MGHPEPDQSEPTNKETGRRRSQRHHTWQFDGNEASLKEFFLYFHPLLLDQARILGVDSDLREEAVMTFLDDNVIELASMDLPPKSLTGYVVRSFRNRVRNVARDIRTRHRVYGDAATEIPGTPELIVAECHSEYGVSSARGEERDENSESEALRRLARFAQGRLSAEEVQLLVEVSRRVPLREIASWHDMSYAACRTRIHRLRSRMRQLTRDYIAALHPTEKGVIERFLRRAGAWEE